MIKKELLLNLFNTTNIQRWNDKLRPIDLVELDYQGHKMMIAYLIGKFEEQNPNFKWVDIIETGIFDLLETSVLTDLKWNVKDELNEREDRRQKKNEYVIRKLTNLIDIVNPAFMAFMERFQTYLESGDTPGLSNTILKAASAFARWWEFQTFSPANPLGYEMEQLREDLPKDKEKYNDLIGCARINRYRRYHDFIELCSQLRFQGRWSYLHIVPRVSVLGHSMFVAVVSYLFSLETEADEETSKDNFFSGLFHDLEETQTRDVRGPLKQDLPELHDVLQEIGKEMMEKNVIPLLLKKWRDEFRRFAAGELKEHSIVKSADNLSAFIEAYRARENGCGDKTLEKVTNPNLEEITDIGLLNLRDIYQQFGCI